MRVIFLGPQGVGKGTQAALLGARFGIPALSTGEMLRSEVKRKTEIGQKADAIMKRGDLVPDDVMLALIRSRLSEADARSGFILDGFPRTPAQAEGLDGTLAHFDTQLNAVVLFKAPREVLLARLSGRRTCPKCGANYNLETHPPKAQGVCDHDGTRLVHRADDTPEAINHRLELYERQTAPLAEYYRKRGQLREIDGTRPIDAVQQALVDALDSQRQAPSTVGAHRTPQGSGSA